MSNGTANDDAYMRSAEALRRRAEDIANKKPLHGPEAEAMLSPEAMRQTLHQLQVHQIELEMQNEELLRTQLQLDTARARYFDLYDLAPVGYCTVSEPGLILEANIMAATLLGMTRYELIGQRVSRFIVTAHQDLFYLKRKQLVDSGVSQSCDVQMVKQDGTQFWAHLVATVETDLDGVATLRMVMSDITERKLAETERARLDQVLQDKSADLERALSLAAKANSAKSDFLSSMSHELRTPLHAILGFTQLLESSSPPPTAMQQTRIEQILRAGWYLLDLINEILDLALIESGKLALSLEPTSLSAVMLECQAMIEAQASERDIGMTFPCFDEPCWVRADQTRLKQVLINLLSNAVKYNRRGGTVLVSCLKQTSDWLRISVKDSGNGLSSEKLAQLFQPFNRLGQETAMEEGTGIGLVMTKRLVELMGGVIGVESAVGVGSEFWVELNLTTEPPPHANANANANANVNAMQPHTLLYIEDNLANLLLMKELVARRPNICLLTAQDGTCGIEIARAEQPDLILLDIKLPGISGIEVLNILAKDTATAHIPVIALSANAMPDDIASGLQAGFFRYLIKPINLDELMLTLNLALQSAQAESAGCNSSPHS